MHTGERLEESGSRLPLPQRDGLDGRAREIYDAICDPASRNLAGLKGPAGMKLHSPRLAEGLWDVGNYLRFESEISPYLREIAILAAARASNSRFEWAAHDQEARRVGVADEVINAIRDNGPLDALEPTERAVIQLVREAVVGGPVSSDVYQHLHTTLGTKSMVDLVWIVGYYVAHAVMLATFDPAVDPARDLLPVDTTERT